MKIILVVAYGKNLEIGKNGDLPGWRLPDDMREFSTLTKGGVVIMGRKTFESFPLKYRPLPERHNFIVTKNPIYVPEPNNEMTETFSNLEEAFANASYKDQTKVFVIGGGEIYLQIIRGLIDGIYDVEVIATEVDGEFPGSDTFFPEIFRSLEWKREILMGYNKGPIAEGSKKENSHNFQIVRYHQ